MTPITLLKLAALAGGGLVLAVAAGANAVANAPLSQIPTALLAVRSDPDAQIAAMDRRFVAQRRYANPTKARDLARKALRKEPLDARAIRLLAYVSEGGPQSDAGLTFNRLAERVSRREDLTQLALTETAVRKNDATEALEHFDIFLRTNPQGQDAVFPLLSQALEAPELRREIARHLRQRSPWARDFIGFASTAGQKPGLTADIVLTASQGTRLQDLEVFGSALLTRLVEAGEFARAARILTLMGGDPKIVGSGQIVAETTTPRYGALAWQLASEGNRSANLGSANDQGERDLAVYAAAGASGSVATKVLMLSPGRHKLSQITSLQSAGGAGTAQWELKCAGGDRPAFWTSSNLLLSDPKGHEEVFNVPAGCSYQELRLFVKAASSGQGVEMTVANFSIN